MKQRCAVVTGVSGGIGGAIAAAFHAQDWWVVGVDCTRDLPDNAAIDAFVSGDVACGDLWQRIGELVRKQGRPLGALVNNAAVQVAKQLVETTPEEWDRVLAVNVGAIHRAMRALHTELVAASPAAVVNVASVHAAATSRGIAAYAASKGAVAALTRALALEMASSGVRVNAILPGAVDTPMLRAGLGRGHLATDTVENQLGALGARIPIRRVGRPEDIAAMALFLSDDSKAGYITGECIAVDGGVLAKLSSE